MTDKIEPTPLSKPPRPVPDERHAHTEHSLTIATETGPQTLRYRVTASLQHLRNDEGDPVAAIFTTSYVRTDVDVRAIRPVTFCFNGGPGSSSVWLHLGWMGPMRVPFNEPKHPGAGPYRLEPNDATALLKTDLVFVDPVGTGYSRAIGEGKLEDYASVKGDIDSMAALIQLWLTRHARWPSPKFLVGESYGATRVAGLASELQDRGVVLNGVGLISAAIDFEPLEWSPTNDLANILYLPSYAAAAAFHATGTHVDAAMLERVRQFAMTHYATALLRGNALTSDELDSVASEVALLVGLPAKWLSQAGLRINPSRFMKELLRERGQVVGRFDARFVGHDVDTVGGEAESDPSFAAPIGPYRALIAEYLRQTLHVEEDRDYTLHNPKVNEAWKWEVPKGRSGGFVNMISSLRRAMLENPHLRLFFANGMYDLATPFFANEHAARHLGQEPHLRTNVHEHLYMAGHMMYLDPTSRDALSRDFLAFIDAALPR